MLLRESLKCYIKFNFQVGQREVGLSMSHWLDLDAEKYAVGNNHIL